MNMNKYTHNILIILGVSLGLFSCTDSFLDTESMTEINEENFYKTIADAEMALVGCYD